MNDAFVKLVLEHKNVTIHSGHPSNILICHQRDSVWGLDVSIPEVITDIRSKKEMLNHAKYFLSIDPDAKIVIYLKE